MNLVINRQFTDKHVKINSWHKLEDIWQGQEKGTRCSDNFLHLTCLCFIRKTKLFLPATCCMKFILFEFEHHLMKQRRNNLNFHCSSCALLLQVFQLQHRHAPITACVCPLAYCLCNMCPMHTHEWGFSCFTSPQHIL